jgi:hypothetical protein
MSHDADIFARHQIDIKTAPARLRELYSEPSGNRYADAPRNLEAAEWRFKVELRHIRYFLIDVPDSEELRDVLEGMKALLNPLAD